MFITAQILPTAKQPRSYLSTTAAAYGKGDAAQSGDGGELSTNPWPPSDTGSTSSAVQCPVKPWRFHYSESVPRHRGSQLNDNQGPSPVWQLGLDTRPFRQWGTDFINHIAAGYICFVFCFPQNHCSPGKPRGPSSPLCSTAAQLARLADLFHSADQIKYHHTFPN